MNRRNFLKKSLIAAGLVAVPTILVQKVIAKPVDPAVEYHLDKCRDLYRQYPLTPKECYISLVKKYAKYYEKCDLVDEHDELFPYKNKREGYMNVDFDKI